MVRQSKPVWPPDCWCNSSPEQRSSQLGYPSHTMFLWVLLEHWQELKGPPAALRDLSARGGYSILTETHWTGCSPSSPFKSHAAESWRYCGTCMAPGRSELQAACPPSSPQSPGSRLPAMREGLLYFLSRNRRGGRGYPIPLEHSELLRAQSSTRTPILVCVWTWMKATIRVAQNPNSNGVMTFEKLFFFFKSLPYLSSVCVFICE